MPKKGLPGSKKNAVIEKSSACDASDAAADSEGAVAGRVASWMRNALGVIFQSFFSVLRVCSATRISVPLGFSKHTL